MAHPPPRTLAAVRLRLLELSQALQDWPWFDTLSTLRLRFREDRLGLTASSLTFTTLIGLVPLVTVMLSLFSAFPVFARFQAALQEYFLRTLVPDNIAKPVMEAITQFASQSNRLGSVGLVLVLATALALVFTIDRTLNTIWRVPKPRPWTQRLLVYWAAITLGPLLLGASLALTSYAISASQGMVARLPGGVGVLLGAIEWGLMAGAFAMLFRFVPNTPVRWRHAWAGGLLVAVGMELAQRALGWYLLTVPTYSVVYGAFATVPIFLLWIYLVWVIVLMGAVVAAYAPTLAMRVTRLSDRPGERFALALRVLAQLSAGSVGAAAASTWHQRAGTSVAQVATALRVDPLQVASVLAVLHRLDWCAALDEAGDPRWVMLVVPERTLAQPLIDSLLLGNAQHTQAFRARAGLAQLTLAELLNP